MILKKTLPHWCYDLRLKETVVDTIVLHSMLLNSRSSLVSLSDVAWHIFRNERLSVHYLILDNGAIYQFAGDNFKCRHAGKSIMPDPDNRIDVNEFSIGIELIQSKRDLFTNNHYESLAKLCMRLTRTYEIKKENIVGHDAIAGKRAVRKGLRTRLEKKTDPGKKFLWNFFFNSF